MRKNYGPVIDIGSKVDILIDMKLGAIEFNVDGKSCGWLTKHDPKLQKGPYFLTIFGADTCFIRIMKPVMYIDEDEVREMLKKEIIFHMKKKEDDDEPN